MPPRRKLLRKVLDPPIISGFKPYGQDSEKQNRKPVNLLYEEYEALRLSDYNKLNHQQSSEIMGVSRPTFTRIYATSLQKIAEAFIEGREITIKGGEFYFDSNWHHCNTCNSYFSNPNKEKIVENCALCGGHHFKEYNYTYDDTELIKGNNLCICPSCGYEQKHKHGRKCNQEICPTCRVNMKRKNK